MNKTVAAEFVEGHFLRFNVEGSVLRMYINGDLTNEWSLRNTNNFSDFLVKIFNFLAPDISFKLSQTVIAVQNEFVRVLNDTAELSTSEEGTDG